MNRSFALDPKALDRLFALLMITPFLLGAIYMADWLIGSPIWLIKRLVDLDGENSFPAWFSSMLLFLVGITFLVKALGECVDGGPSNWFFLLGAAGFLFLSADEALFIHESVGEALNKHHSDVSQLLRFKNGYGAWIPIYLGVIGVLGFVTGPQIWRFWRVHRCSFKTLAIGAAVFLSGAVGLEIVSYQFKEIFVAVPAIHTAEIVAEEILEMLGSITMLRGCLTLFIDPNLQRVSLAARETSAESWSRRQHLGRTV